MRKKLLLFCGPYWRQVISFITILLIVFSIISCNKFKDDFDFSKVATPEWNPEFAVPLINSTLTLSDFFEDSSNLFIQVNPDNSLSFVYGMDEIFSQRAEDIINVPEQNFSFQTQVDIPPLLPGVFDTLTLDYSFPFITDTTGQRLDSIILKNGDIRLNFKTNLNRDEASVEIVIPDIVHAQTGEFLQMNVNLNNPGGQSEWVEHEENIPISDYKILLNQEGTAINELNFLAEVVMHGDINPDLSPYDFILSGDIRDIEFEKIFGYLGQYELNLNDSIELSIFEKTIEGGIQLGTGTIDVWVDIENSYGAPVTVDADEFYAVSKVNPPYLVDIGLFGPGVPNIFSIDAPNIQQVGQTIETNLDFSNSNLAEAFNIAPEMLYFDFMALTNPLGDTLASNFILDTSRISLGMDVEVQLFTSISDFIVEDTIDFDLNSDANEIASLLIRLNTVNRFPLNVDVQIYFADDGYNIIDSLISNADERILVGAPVSGPPGYKVTEGVAKMTDFEISRQKLDHILYAEYMMLKAGLSTTDNSLVKIYNDYSLEIKVGTIVGVNIESE